MMRMKRSCANLSAVLSLAAVLGLGGQAAHAALAAPAAEPVLAASAIDATASPSGQALPSFVFHFNAAVDLVGFEVTFEFDPAKLSFDAASSTLSAGGNTVTLPVALATMEAASTIPGPGPDFFYSPAAGDFGPAITTGSFTFTGTYLSQSHPIPAGSSVVMTGVFQVQPGFTAGTTPVRVFGMATDTAFNQMDFDATATVAAVPEPETWLMLLGGLGLIAARVRRRIR